MFLGLSTVKETEFHLKQKNKDFEVSTRNQVSDTDTTLYTDERKAWSYKRKLYI